MDHLYPPCPDRNNMPLAYTNAPNLLSMYEDPPSEQSSSPLVYASTLHSAHVPQLTTQANTHQSYLLPTNRNSGSRMKVDDMPSIARIKHEVEYSSASDIYNATPFTNGTITDLPFHEGDTAKVANMRNRRRAQNRASQRAFRERKERHIQHIERELAALEQKHHNLEQSYDEVKDAHNRMQREYDKLRAELGQTEKKSLPNTKRATNLTTKSPIIVQPKQVDQMIDNRVVVGRSDQQWPYETAKIPPRQQVDQQHQWWFGEIDESTMVCETGDIEGCLPARKEYRWP